MQHSHQWPENFWQHQRTACEQVVDAIASGQRRIVLTAPCGTGKSRVMAALTEWGSSQWWDTILYTHRRMLLRQTSEVLTKHGIEHGMRASGYKTAPLRSVQLAMLQTEASAVLKRQRREIHPAQLAIEDEIHACGGDTLPELNKRHYEQGAAIVGVTATPIDLSGEWDRLIVACTTSEGRNCGALVPAYTYCPDEPDLRHIKNYRLGDDLTDKQNSSAIMRPGVFGRVYTHWKRLNPEARPTVLFGPDVAGAIYFAEEFTRKGVRAAHIDAKQIWYNGEYMDSDDENREWLLKTFESGEIQLLTSRWVLKEGIDLPFVAHAIFACVVGSLKSWLQMGGRAIRYHPDTPSVIIQDHGGCFRRHGSLNADRHWELGMSGYRETGLRQEAMREKPEIEPILCSKCGMMRLSGPTCPACGYSCHKRSKMVVQINGDLKLVEGPTYKKHRVKMESDTVEKWTKMFHRARSKKWNGTFTQALAMFAQENNWFYPPKDLPFMPYDPSDWYQKVSTIWKRNPDGSNAPFPHDRLRSKDS